MSSKKRCFDDHSTVDRNLSSLSEDELGSVYRFVSKMAQQVSEGKLTHKDKWLAVKIKNRDVVLSCAQKQSACQDLHDVPTNDGLTFHVCHGLRPLYEFLKKKEDEKQPASRRVTQSRKVGRYLYKLQPNQGGNEYWYLQFTENGRSTQRYLGKDRPLFKPQADLARIKLKRSRKVKARLAA